MLAVLRFTLRPTTEDATGRQSQCDAARASRNLRAGRIDVRDASSRPKYADSTGLAGMAHPTAVHRKV